MQHLIQNKLFFPLKTLGRLLAPVWPWPVPAKVRSKTLYVDLRSAIGRGIYVKGQFDEEVFESLTPSLKSGSIFIDVGANVGYYSLLAMDFVGVNGLVHAFEIDPRPLVCLKKTVRKNKFLNLVVHECALGEVEGVAYLQMQKDCGHSSAGSGLQGRPVPMATLDSFLPDFKDKSVSALKIDVEGGELAVLFGARELLLKHRPLIVSEIVEEYLQKHGHTTEKLIRYLIEIGYTYRWLDGVHTPTIVAMPDTGKSQL